MGALKQYYIEYLSSEEFDLMSDDEFNLWLERKLQQEQIEREEYLQAIGEGMNQNYCN